MTQGIIAGEVAMASIRNPKDFWAGVLFIAIGIAAIVDRLAYTLGTAARMGPAISRASSASC